MRDSDETLCLSEEESRPFRVHVRYFKAHSLDPNFSWTDCITDDFLYNKGLKERDSCNVCENSAETLVLLLGKACFGIVNMRAPS